MSVEELRESSTAKSRFCVRPPRETRNVTFPTDVAVTPRWSERTIPCLLTDSTEARPDTSMNAPLLR